MFMNMLNEKLWKTCDWTFIRKVGAVEGKGRVKKKNGKISDIEQKGGWVKFIHYKIIQNEGLLYPFETFLRH